ncbi:MAG: hypothetical protein ACR2N3_08310 [Pyrinomonadaceae bacterium]
MNGNFITETQRHGVLKNSNPKAVTNQGFLFWLYFSLCLCAAAINLSCSSKPTDMRSLAPNDALVYLETKDLGAMLQTLTENKAWESLAKEKTDFSQLKNIQVAVVVTGFEASEKPITNESSVLNFKPHFAAIADTRQWKSTAVSIAETEIGKFVRKNYGDDARLEKLEKDDAKFFVWTSADGARKFFAAVSGSVIYAGNDESLLDKCLAVRRGAAESLAKNENLARARETADAENKIAFGYVSPEGIAQIANLVGISTAIEASEEDLPRSFIAKILPEIVRKTAREIVWTAQKNEQGIEDKIFVKTDAETASVFKETLQSKTENQTSAADYLPVQFDSITRYNLQNPQLAWRSVLLVAAKQTDAGSAKILTGVSGAFFEPYGIADGETFLSAIDSPVFTARFDEDGEKSVVIAQIKDTEKLKKSITKEINFKPAPEKVGDASVWKSADGDSAAAFVENNLVILGERQSLLDCLQAKMSNQNFAKTLQFQSSRQRSAASVSVKKDEETAQEIVEILGNAKEENKQYAGFYTTETRFANGGIERRTISDFGLIGMIVEKFDDSGR